MAADVDRTRRWSQTQRHTPGPVPKAPEHVHGLRDVYTHPFYLTRFMLSCKSTKNIQIYREAQIN